MFVGGGAAAQPSTPSFLVLPPHALIPSRLPSKKSARQKKRASRALSSRGNERGATGQEDGALKKSGLSSGEGMIRRTFLFLPRITREGEERLWRAGITEWDSFLAVEKVLGVGASRKRWCDRSVRGFARAVAERDAPSLARILPASEHWRLYPLFQEEALYLDIESTGRYGEIAVLGAWDGEQYHPFVRGRNLEKEPVHHLLARSRMLVTFNGSSFDLPLLRRYFAAPLPEGLLRVDLRHLCARLGLTGGLKRIEEVLGITRPAGVRGMTGEEAILLWRQYLVTGEEDFLEAILAYNEADCKNLELLAERAVSALSAPLERETVRWGEEREGER